MRKLITISIGLLLLFILSGCIGEDYDVGVPTAHLDFEGLQKQLTEANIYWKTASEDVQKTIENIEEYALSQDEIRVYPSQKASLAFKENEDNGGDIWTDPKIKISLLQEGEWIELLLDESDEIQFPADKGNYVLLVSFTNSAGTVQYVGNIVVVN